MIQYRYKIIVGFAALLISAAVWGQTTQQPGPGPAPSSGIINPGTSGNCAKYTGSTTIGDAGALCGSGGGASFTTSIYTSNTALFTLNSTTLVIHVIRQVTPAALTVNLPASPATNLYKCVKDGGNNFATNNATVKTTDGSQIDGVAGASGYVMNQNLQHSCFVYDGTMWDIN